jgi:hypothetical protein
VWKSASVMKLGMYITALGPISTTYLINPSHQSACLYVHPLIVAMKRLGKNIPEATDIHAIIEELLDESFSIRCVSIKGKYTISSSKNLLFQLEN